MAKKRRRKRYRLKKSVKRKLILVLILLILCLVLSLVVRLIRPKKPKEVYEPQTFEVVYEGDLTRYTFDVQAFLRGERAYVSLNDYYNLVVIEDPEAKVDVKNNEMTFTNKKGTTVYNYKRDTVNASYTVSSTKIEAQKDGSLTLKGEDNKFFVIEEELYVPVILSNIMNDQLKLTLSFKEKKASVAVK